MNPLISLRISSILVLSFLIAGNLYSQQMSKVLSLQNVDATFNSNGHLFTSLSNGNIAAGFEFPRNSSHHTIFTASYWISGIDSATGILHSSVNTYPNTFKNIFSGPVQDAPFTNQSVSGVFEIDKSTVIDFQQNYGSQGYIIPSAILNWPANGVSNIGMSKMLAPFRDFNSNSVYEPINEGDYPLVLGSKNLYFLNNDISETRQGLANSSPLNIEIETYAYELETEYEALSDCIFLNVQLKNRSDRSYEDLYTGLWFDFDIGGSNDDYIGSDSSRNLFFAYNADNDDSDYGNLIPAQGVMVLNQNLSSFVGYNNSSNPVNGEPNTLLDFNNLLRGLWRDGSPIRNTGNGTGGNGNVTSFHYNFGVNQETGPGSDKRGIGSLGPVKLRPNQTFCVDLVVFPAIDSTNNSAHASLIKLISKADTIQNLFNLIGNGCSAKIISQLGHKSHIDPLEFRLHPNPATSVINIESKPIKGPWEIKIMDLMNTKTVLRKNGNGPLPMTLSIRSIPSGMYLFSLQTKDSLKTLKIIIDE